MVSFSLSWGVVRVYIYKLGLFSIMRKSATIEKKYTFVSVSVSGPYLIVSYRLMTHARSTRQVWECALTLVACWRLCLMLTHAGETQARANPSDVKNGSYSMIN